jgi:hypothetical protein
MGKRTLARGRFCPLEILLTNFWFGFIRWNLKPALLKTSLKNFFRIFWRNFLKYIHFIGPMEWFLRKLGAKSNLAF